VLKLKCIILLSTLAFKFNLRRYNKGVLAEIEAAEALTAKARAAGRGLHSSTYHLNLSRF